MIGCGYLSVGQHGPSVLEYIDRYGGVEFSACCDIDEKKAREFKDEFKVAKYYTDYIEMLDAEKPDAVSLICPVDKTAELSCRIMERGYPIILEKPPGLTGAETRKMIEVAEKSGVPNQVAFNRRYIPLVKKMKDILNGADCSAGSAGSDDSNKIMDIHYRMIRVNRRDLNFSTTAIHGIDLVRYVAGVDYKCVDLRYNELPQFGERVANIHMSGEMINGTCIHMDFLPMSGAVTERLEVNTHMGLFRLELPVWADGEDKHGCITQLLNGKVVYSASCVDLVGNNDEYMINGMYHENESFLNDIRNGIKPKGDIESGLQSVEIADCINKRKNTYSF